MTRIERFIKWATSLPAKLIEGVAVTIVVALVGDYIIKHHKDNVTVSLWVAGVILLACLALVIGGAGAGLRAGRRHATNPEAEDERLALEWELDRHIQFAQHLLQCHARLRLLIAGSGGVPVERLLEHGLLDPARELLTVPEEHIWLAILVPSEGVFQMPFSSGYTMEGHRDFELHVQGSFSEITLQTGQMVESADLEDDPRWASNPRVEPHPATGSIMSIPIRAGDQTVAVFNVMSSWKNAFASIVDRAYILTLAGVIEIIWTLMSPPRAPSTGGPSR